MALRFRSQTSFGLFKNSCDFVHDKDINSDYSTITERKKESIQKRFFYVRA